MTTLTVIDWDKWRADYPTMTFEDQREFYGRVAELFPCQESYHLDECHAAFDYIGIPDADVVELGGWNGRLASNMIARGDIVEWVNYDIADVPQVIDVHGYRRVVLEDWIWTNPIEGDVFVACHTIEHLSHEHLTELLAALRTELVYLEAPLAGDPYDWAGFPGSHKLEIGWLGVADIMETFGYEHEGWTIATGIVDVYGKQGIRSGLWRKT